MNSVARPRRLLLALYLASAALVTVQQAILGHSNNLSIFRAASLNLFAGRDLYAAHPEQHFDFYKYSPTFALLFAPLAYLPFALAFLCWALLNGLLLWYALDRLLPEREATVALALLYLEVLLALQYGQSNALVAALMILAFIAFEGRRQLGAALSITGGAAIKLFPLAPPAPVRRHLQRGARDRSPAAPGGRLSSRAARTVPLVARHRGEGRAAARVLADALHARMARRGLAQLAAAGRRHRAAAAPARPALRRLGQPRVPAAVPVLAARLLGAVQPRV